MNKSAYYISTGCLIILGWTLSYGQNVRLISLKRFTEADGLSSYYITKIIQDDNGYLWVGTQAGLNRFNGSNFTRFSPRSAPGQQFIDGNVSDLVEDRSSHELWVATTGDLCAVSTLTATITRHVPLDPRGKPWSSEWIRSLALAGNVLWIGTSHGLYGYRTSDGHFLISTIKGTVSKLITTSDGLLWAFCDKAGVYLLNGQTGSRLDSLGAKLAFNDVTRDGKNHVYAATSEGILQLARSEDSPVLLPAVPVPLLPRGSPVLSCRMDGNDTLWYTTAQALYYRDLARNKNVQIQERFPSGDGWLSAIYQVLPDAEGHIWIGNQQGLAVFSPDPSPFISYAQADPTGDHIRHAYTLNKLDPQTLLCGDLHGLYTVHLETGRQEKIGNATSNILLPCSGTSDLFLSNSQGFFRYVGNHFEDATRKYPCLDTLRHQTVDALLSCNDSLVLLGSFQQNGFYIWNTRRGTLSLYDRNMTPSNFPPLSVTEGLYKSHDGRIWVLTQNAVLLFDPVHYTDRPFQLRDPATGHIASLYFDMCETSNGFWIGSYGAGLIETDLELRCKQILTEQEGLSNNYVYKVFPWNDSLILSTSNNGLSVLNLRTRRMRTYYEADGLHSSDFEQLCGLTDGNRIFAGGINGFTEIDPIAFGGCCDPPHVYIDRVSLTSAQGTMDTGNLALRELSIPSNTLQTTFYFVGLDYLNPRRTTYSYRIKGYNSHWISLGNRNSVSLYGLDPGTYTLEVRAGSQDGSWRDKPVTLVLVFEPKWYQMLWFKLAIALVLCIILYTVYRYRIAQIHQQQQIRKDIASDLHDDLGSLLNTVKIFTHLAKREPTETAHLDHIEDSVSQATLGLRDMLWVLDDSRDTARELVDRIKKFAQPVAKASEMHLTTSIPEELENHTLSKIEKRYLLIIAKETINNSIKYSHAANLYVSCRMINGRIAFSIRDDGRGFDPAQPTEGNGLRNLRHRAQQIKYDIRIETGIGEGTTVEVVKL